VYFTTVVVSLSRAFTKDVESCKMLVMADRSPFSQFLFDAFLDWEKSQPGMRSNFTKFSEYLGVKQQALSSWLNDRTTPNLESIELLASKLGDSVYDILNLSEPDHDLVMLIKLWPRLSEETRQEIRKQAEKYASDNAASQAAHPPLPVEKAA
jgi:transcriptional regulator with XRE-family HTH domain